MSKKISKSSSKTASKKNAKPIAASAKKTTKKITKPAKKANKVVKTKILSKPLANNKKQTVKKPVAKAKKAVAKAKTKPVAKKVVAKAKSKPVAKKVVAKAKPKALEKKVVAKAKPKPATKKVVAKAKPKKVIAKVTPKPAAKKIVAKKAPAKEITKELPKKVIAKTEAVKVIAPEPIIKEEEITKEVVTKKSKGKIVEIKKKTISVPAPQPLDIAKALLEKATEKFQKEPAGKFELEYVVHTSTSILFEFLTSPSGMAEWFCDDVNIRNENYTFFWDGTEQQAKLAKYIEEKLVRFQWVEKNDGSYFEFKIERDELTNDISLIITDFALTTEERESAKLLWDSQIEKLMHVLGGYF